MSEDIPGREGFDGKSLPPHAAGPSRSRGHGRPRRQNPHAPELTIIISFAEGMGCGRWRPFYMSTGREVEINKKEDDHIGRPPPLTYNTKTAYNRGIMLFAVKADIMFPVLDDVSCRSRIMSVAGDVVEHGAVSSSLAFIHWPVGY